MPTNREGALHVPKPGLIRASRFHLETVGESYAQHFRAAVAIALRLARASGACALHALVPGFCARTASSEVGRLNAELVRRSGECERQRDARSTRGNRSHIEIESS